MFSETDTRNSLWPPYRRKTNPTVWQETYKLWDVNPGMQDTDQCPPVQEWAAAPGLVGSELVSTPRWRITHHHYGAERVSTVDNNPRLLAVLSNQSAIEEKEITLLC